MLRTLGAASFALVAVLVGGIFLASSAAAQAAPSIKAVPASAADTYRVTGSGFQPGAALKVVEVTCGPLPCAAGGGGFTLAKADAAGSFDVSLVLNANTVPTDRDFRVIAAWPDERAGLASDPQVRVALHHAGATATVPGAPATGSGVSDNDSPAWPIAAGAALVAAAGALGLGLRRRTSQSRA